MRAALISKIVLALTFLIAATERAWPAEETRRAQEELRKRHLYFGDIDGELSEQTILAVRRYQQRKGFPATGELDAMTLGALNIGAPPEFAPDPWPAVPVLKSDTAAEIAEKDRAFLEQMAAEEEIVPVPAVVAQSPTPVEESRATQLEQFVRRYLEVCEANALDDEMAFYGPQVRYFDHGLVDEKFIRRDVGAYYKRWPERDYELLDFQVLADGPEEAAIRFRISFRVHGAKHQAAGRTDNFFTLRPAGEAWKFVAMRERRVPAAATAGAAK